MSQLLEIKVPDIGDYKDVPVIEVHVKPGDKVEKEQSLITLESDKATMDVPSSHSGVVKELKVKVGDTISEGGIVLILEGSDAAASPAASKPASAPAPTPTPITTPAPTPVKTTPALTPTPAPVAMQAAAVRSEVVGTIDGASHASPSVRKFARELGVTISQVKGTGPKGRITQEDVQAYVKSVMTGASSPAGAAAGGSLGGLNLVVPVIRNADQKGIFEIARETAELAALAREGKLKPEQMQGASFTISSLGGIGGTYFAPIINAPEVAILGVSKAAMKPVWNGKEFVPRLICPLSLTADHRVIDGALATRFTVYIAQLLADFRRAVL